MDFLKLQKPGRPASKIIVVERDGRTTAISVPAEMYADMLKFANQDPYVVSDACRAAARKLKGYTAANFSEACREKALASLRGGYIPARDIQKQLYALYLENEAAFAEQYGDVIKVGGTD